MALQPSDRLDMAINGSYLANFINQIQLEVAECDSVVSRGFKDEVIVKTS